MPDDFGEYDEQVKQFMDSNREFISFKQFLLVANYKHLINRYDIARKSWEKYGNDGPPIGSTVQVLETKIEYKFDGIDPNNDQYFLISQWDQNNFGPYRTIGKLIKRSTWWAKIRVVEG